MAAQLGIHYVAVKAGSVAPFCENTERFLIWTSHPARVTCAECLNRLAAQGLTPDEPLAEGGRLDQKP